MDNPDQSPVKSTVFTRFEVLAPGVEVRLEPSSPSSSLIRSRLTLITGILEVGAGPVEDVSPTKVWMNLAIFPFISFISAISFRSSSIACVNSPVARFRS